MPFYDAGDAAIWYEITGVGRPLLLLHGYALNSLMWEYQKPAFQDKYRLILIDLRGFGKSSCGPRWSAGVMASDVCGIIESLDLPEACILGYSMSGPVAFRVALQMPQRINALILASSILPSAGQEIPALENKTYEREIEILKSGGVEAWVDKTELRAGPLVENLFKRKPEILQLWDNIFARHNADYLTAMLAARGKVSAKTNWRERLKDVTQPTLIIAGKEDTKFVDASNYLHRLIAGSKLEIFEKAGHMVNLEKPEIFNQIVEYFIDAI